MKKMRKGVGKVVKGVVKKWISDRSCGMITCNRLSEGILVKRSNLKGMIYLEEGEEVQFKIKKSKRGPIAINVEPINC